MKRLAEVKVSYSILDACVGMDTKVEFPDRDVDGRLFAYLDGLPAEFISFMLFLHVGQLLQVTSEEFCWAVTKNLLRGPSIKRRFEESAGAWQHLSPMDRLSRGYAALWALSGGWRSTNWITRAWDALIRCVGDHLAKTVAARSIPSLPAPPPSSIMSNITSHFATPSAGSSQFGTPSYGTFLPSVSLPDMSAMSSTWADLASQLQPDANDNDASSAASSSLARDLSLATGQGLVAAAARFVDELEAFKLTTADGASAFAAAFHSSAAMPSHLEAVARAIRAVGSIIPGSVPIPMAVTVGHRDRLVFGPLAEPRPPLPADETGDSASASSRSQRTTTSASSSTSPRKSAVKTKKQSASSKGAKTTATTKPRPNRLRKAKKPDSKEDTILRRSERLLKVVKQALPGRKKK